MTDPDYQFGYSDPEPAGPENRADYRLTATAQATLELEGTDPAWGGDRITSALSNGLACRIRDMSASGLCLLSGQEVPVEAIIPARVSMSCDGRVFQLILEVVWCRPNQSGFLVGAQIVESDDTDYVEWVEAIAQALAEG